MEKTKTAVEWLVNVVQSCIAPDYIPKEIIQQALQMEKEQKFNQFDIQQAYRAGYRNAEEYIKGDLRYFISSEQYYTETYGSTQR